MSPETVIPCTPLGTWAAPTMMLFGLLGSTTRSAGLPLASVSLTAKSPLPRLTTSVFWPGLVHGELLGRHERRAEDLRVVRVGDVQNREGEVVADPGRVLMLKMVDCGPAVPITKAGCPGRRRRGG